MNNKPKICITFSSGGHFFEAMQACSKINNYNKFYVTFNTPHLWDLAKKEKIYFVMHPRHNPFRLLINLFQSIIILIKEKPDVIISTGADVTVHTFIIGKLLNRKTIYIESGANVYSPALTGMIVYHFADLFLVQWKPIKKVFPKAVVGGPLF